MRKLIHTTLIITGMGMTSCYYDHEEFLYPTEFEENCGPEGVSYSLDSVDVIIATSCAISGCHGDNQSPILIDLEEIQNNTASILNQVESGTMPKGATLTAEEIRKISCWIKNGALDN